MNAAVISTDLLKNTHMLYNQNKEYEIVIYDEYSLEAILTTALFLASYEASTGRRPNTMTASIAVTRNVPTVDGLFIGSDHTYNNLKTNNKKVFKDIISLSSLVNSEYSLWLENNSEISDTTNLSNSLFYRYLVVSNEVTGLSLQIAVILELFKSNSKTMKNIVYTDGLNNLTLLFINSKKAINSIILKETFNLTEIDDADIERYSEFNKILKSHLVGKYDIPYVYSESVKHSGQLYLSAPSSDTPWLVKFLSLRFSEGVIYGISGNNVFISTWGNKREASFPSTLKNIKRAFSSNLLLNFVGSAV